MAALQDAIALAHQAHEGQTDKAGARYVDHVLRVMSRMSTDEEKMAAVLHDVVEDAGVTLADLRAAGYPEPVVQAVDCLTRRKPETYEEFIARVKLNALATKVKIADLEDNMNLGRLRQPRQEDYQRAEKYRGFWRELTALADRAVGAPQPLFKYYAVFSNGEIRGLFAVHKGEKRLDTLAWNHRSRRWEDDPAYVGRHFRGDLDAEEVSRARAEEIARRFEAPLPADSELLKISDEAEVRRRSGSA